MPDVPDEAVQAVAERMFRRYESEYDASHLTWQDFADDARAGLEAAAPILAEAWGTSVPIQPDEPPVASFDERDLAVIGMYQECPESKMDDGSHATDYEDGGSCPWCGEQNPDRADAENDSAQAAAIKEDGGS